jgi:hypothetical protein
MSFLEKIDINKNDKKMVSARISKDILDALDMAKKEIKNSPEGEALNGYTFSLTRIIEKAFISTLEELEDKTGTDFYALEKFKSNIRHILCNQLHHDEADVDKIITKEVESIESEYHERKYGKQADKNSKMRTLILKRQAELEEKFYSKAWEEYYNKGEYA